MPQRWYNRRPPSEPQEQVGPAVAPSRPHGLFLHDHSFVEDLLCELPANPAHVSAEGPCTLGAFSYVNGRLAMARTRVGRYCSIGPDCLINPGNHNLEFLSTHPFVSDPSGVSSGIRGVPAYVDIAGTTVSASGRVRLGTVELGHDVWLGARVIVLGGVSIGHGAVVAAGATVTRDVEPYAIVAGNPARVVRRRFDDAMIRRLLEAAWWDYDLAALGPERDYTDIDAVLDRLARGLAAGSIGRPAFAHVLVRQTHLRVLDAGEDGERARALPIDPDRGWLPWRWGP